MANLRHAVWPTARAFLRSARQPVRARRWDQHEQLDARQGGSGAAGGGKFMAAGVEGTRVLFTDESRLTPDAKAEAGKPDLYE